MANQFGIHFNITNYFPTQYGFVLWKENKTFTKGGLL